MASLTGEPPGLTQEPSASLLQASQYVEVIEQRQGLKIGCIEEIAYQMGFIDAAQLVQVAEPLLKSGYGQYLLGLIERK